VYRINKNTPAEVATGFGPITLRSFLYLSAEDGELGLHPLHGCLGVVAGGATAALAERVTGWAVDRLCCKTPGLLQKPDPCCKTALVINRSGSQKRGGFTPYSGSQLWEKNPGQNNVHVWFITNARPGGRPVSPLRKKRARGLQPIPPGGVQLAMRDRSARSERVLAVAIHFLR
jgi:hypothetical protein